jgi:hypothetical protein
MLLRGVDERPIDSAMSPRIGAILKAASTVHVVDASLVEIRPDGDEVLTTDPVDIAALATTARRRLIIIPNST